jgi:peroxiredoxin (alkyl hydroperoxide reductase subunit C)
VDEVLRLVEALQTTDANAVATPVNWQPGEKVVVPPPKTVEDVAERNSHSDYERFDFYLNKKSL